MAKSVQEPPNSPRPRRCPACNGQGGKWVEKKTLRGDKVASERHLEVCRKCDGRGTV